MRNHHPGIGPENTPPRQGPPGKTAACRETSGKKSRRTSGIAATGVTSTHCGGMEVFAEVGWGQDG